jgi:hypothetical protein
VFIYLFANSSFGATLLQYGIFIRARIESIKDGSSLDVDDMAAGMPSNASHRALVHTEWISYLLMLLGWILIMKSFGDYFRIRKLHALLQSAPEAMIV